MIHRYRMPNIDGVLLHLSHGERLHITQLPRFATGITTMRRGPDLLVEYELPDGVPIEAGGPSVSITKDVA